LEKFQAPIAFGFSRIILICSHFELPDLKNSPIPGFWRNAVFLHFVQEKMLTANYGNDAKGLS